MLRILKKFIYLFSLWLFTVYLSPVVFAQEPPPPPSIDWRELPTQHFIIVYAEEVENVSHCDCGIQEAEFYQEFIDQIYSDLVGVFNIKLRIPLNLRLFPTEESYFEVNPLAEQIPGVVAHALNNRAEIAIALPRTNPLSDEQIINNMRHELTHLFASLLSDGNLTTGFQEGIAQYLERPTNQSGYDPAVLQQALDQGRLLTWAELDQAGQIWQDPQVGYPQSLSIAAFLIDRYGFSTFVEFIQAHTYEPGYRSALETTYGKSADVLEAEWLAYLPDYFAGRWKINALYAYDLSRVTQLVENGAYTDAETELAEIVELLQTTNQTETLANADNLLTLARQGLTAGTLAAQARQALAAHNYPETIAKANQSINAYESLGYHQRVNELQTYIQRAEIGQDALNQMERGTQLLKSFRFFEAETQIRDATILLQSLGNQPASRRGVDLLVQLSTRQQWLAYLMLAVGGLLLILNGVRRLAIKFSADPLEVEFL